MITELKGITQDEYIAELYSEASKLTEQIERLKGEAEYQRELGNLERMASYLRMVADYSHDLGLNIGILIGLGKAQGIGSN